jgi:hypothetical protein
MFNVPIFKFGLPAGTSVAAASLVLRRILALVGFLFVVALALMLFYGMYVHHTRVEPYTEGGPAVVRLDVKFARDFS